MEMDIPMIKLCMARRAPHTGSDSSIGMQFMWRLPIFYASHIDSVIGMGSRDSVWGSIEDFFTKYFVQL